MALTVLVVLILLCSASYDSRTQSVDISTMEPWKLKIGSEKDTKHSFPDKVWKFVQFPKPPLESGNLIDKHLTKHSAMDWHSLHVVGHVVSVASHIGCVSCYRTRY